MLAKTSALSGEGELYDEGRQLSALIGRPTTPIRDTIAAALGA
jgi:NAD(P)H dehydrogenase (quinone)